MNQIKQTLESIQSDFDRIALTTDESWNHNAQYHEFLLNQFPKGCQNVLEIGCGTGAFSRLLAACAKRVLALDLSPQMIRLAGERSRLYPNINFVESNVMTYRLPNDHFDGIATLTTLHHLPMADILKKIKMALKPGGTFVCLDLYQRADLTDLFFEAAAYPISLLLTLKETGRLQPPKEVREAYAEHGKTDTYLTLTQIRKVCAEILPGAIIKRHLFWRYSITWRNTIEE